MTKLVSAVLLLMVAGATGARGQELTSELISDADKSSIVESVLDQERRNQNLIPDFASIRDVSSDNLEFIEPARLSSRGFELVAASYLSHAKKDRVISYLLFKKNIFARRRRSGGSVSDYRRAGLFQRGFS